MRCPHRYYKAVVHQMQTTWNHATLHIMTGPQTHTQPNSSRYLNNSHARTPVLASDVHSCAVYARGSKALSSTGQRRDDTLRALESGRQCTSSHRKLIAQRHFD